MKRRKFLNRNARWRKILDKLKFGELPKPKPLKKLSEKKQVWIKLYNQKKAASHKFQYCARCKNGDHIGRMDPHHPYGRLGERMLDFIWVCKPCHTWIHDNGKQSRTEGWLQPAFDGRIQKPDTPKPWEIKP